MRKERQIGLRVGIPALFCMELEEYHKHAQGAHRALVFPDFLGFLIGLGLEAYRKGTMPEPEEAPDIEDEPEEKEGRKAALHLFDINPAGLPDLFREFDEAMKTPEEKLGLRLVHAGECPGKEKISCS
jgi:hypothetical protein